MHLLPRLDGFRDEMEKIAVGKVGLGLGLLGLGVGYGGYRAAKAGKRMFYDEPNAREHAAIFNYVPSAVRQQIESPYGPYVR